jgi:hypothetical protein
MRSFEDLTPDEQEDYRRIWTDEVADWVLRPGRKNPDRLMAFNVVRKSMMVFDNELLRSYVIAKMLEAGVRVIDNDG